jgi:hypothetical protein
MQGSNATRGLWRAGERCMMRHGDTE